ncbi:DEAD H helicase [Mycena kentingensis (nom. inval.)]|nr:DEAD H helicase [Mycena kentingensis (nom. inval.)]
MPPRKKRRVDKVAPEWPPYFNELFKVFKALNTVLAFVSSRKHMASSFPSIRASVESLLKRPLDLEDVAQLKSLLPDLVSFAYTPRNALMVHESQEPSRIPDFRLGARPQVRDEHILVLEFVDKSQGKKIDDASQMLSAPPTLTPTGMKKLIEKRNDRFQQAVNELLLATDAEEDPVELLKAAARDHIPVQPGSQSAFAAGPIPDAESRPSVEEVLEDIKQQDWYLEQITERRTVEPKQVQTGTLDFELSDSIKNALRDARNITSFYAHQAEALNAINQGKHAIVSTNTATGKSVTYQVPVLRFLEDNSASTALFIYPTKALAQDQKAAMEKLLACSSGLEHVKVNTYDGDTPQENRAAIRQDASVIFTNFDMIHAGILPFEDVWRGFLRNLKIIAVDELHYYSGVLGSHVAQIIRRLRRVLTALGNSRVIFVSCSATLSRPSLHMERICGLPPSSIQPVTVDSAPSGKKEYVIWSPPSNAMTDRPVSCISEATTLMTFFMQRGIRTILFCKHRKVCELAMKSLRVELTRKGRYDMLERVKSYRGGYSQQDRRQIEHDAFTGHLLGIIATNALELGVDIGSLDAVIMLGFPSSVASFRQQAGRAGRRSRDSLALFIAEALPIDQYYAKDPDRLFDKDVGDLVVELDNRILLEAHLQCAAHEMPLCDADELFFGPLMKDICLTSLRRDNEGWYHAHAKFLPFPSKFISIRGIQEEVYTVIDMTNGHPRLLEEIEVSRAQFEVYEGGVFMHQGRSYIVKQISHDSKRALVVEADVNWHTSPRDFTNVDAIQTYRIKEIRNSSERAFYGRVGIQVLVYGFYKIRNFSILDTVYLDNEPWEHETTGFWIDVPPATLELLRSKNFKPASCIHSAQHALLNRFVLKADVKTECKAEEKENKATESSRRRPARLIFFDAPGGTAAGTSAKAFDNVSDLLVKAERTVGECGCEEGCANCIHSPSCKEKNVISSKLGALVILRGILGIPIDPNTIPLQPRAK